MVPHNVLRAVLTGAIAFMATTGAGAQSSGVQPDSAALRVAIHGQILDSLTRKPISLAEVTVRGTLLRGSSDLRGHFIIRLVPAGFQTLEVRGIGYNPLIVDSLNIDGGEPPPLVLVLSPAAVQLRELTVTPGTFSIMESGPASRQTLSREKIESAPFGEDLFRAVSRLPGLSSGDYAAHFSIRGGRHDETLILLEDLEIYEPYHMKDFNEGALSIVDVGVIEGV